MPTLPITAQYKSGMQSMLVIPFLISFSLSVYPPKEADALFVTTNFLASLQQSRGVCPGTAPDESCNVTTPCVNMTVTTNGINAGMCNSSANFCDIYAWCPAEQYSANMPPNNELTGVENFTVFIRSSVKFPKWNVMR